jgi:acetyl-CoA carboxylase biotin carboxylase subunit
MPPAQSRSEAWRKPIPVAIMRTLLVCRGPIAHETLEIYQQRAWTLPHVLVSAQEWIADRQCSAPWIADLPSDHVHHVQEYTDIEAILHIAATQRIDAIYPGYGFLAENAAFAERVQQAGMRFVGPTPQSLRAIGDKDAAIALAKRLDIPTIPGDDKLVQFAYRHRQVEIIDEAVSRVLAIVQQYPGYPIRLKHPAGGGGKGQRVLTAQALQGSEARTAIVDALTKLWAEIGVSPAAADAQKGVLIELNIPRPLHWEVQLFGDGERVVHLAARDCSVQNHGYQKFIELALHPTAIASEIERLDAHRDAARIDRLQRRQATLATICDAALRLGEAIGLRGAATVEFLIDTQGKPYFLEVNPRIQVEHGVTEGIARVRGEPLRLVEWQQRVAAGEKLDVQQEDITFTGDAIEVRLNAWHEDLSPVLGGVVHALRLEAPPERRDRIRVDASGLLQRRQSWTVPSYDANFALIIVSGVDRRQTLDDLIAVLDTDLQVHGNAELQTNRQPMIGLLTLMRALPPETEFRTDTSLLWMGMTAVIEAQKNTALALLPRFPRHVEAYDSAVFARLLQATLESGFAYPSRLLAFYLKRLTQMAARPLTPLEVLWDLAEELKVPLFEEERQQGVALRLAAEALWDALSGCRTQFATLLQDVDATDLASRPVSQRLIDHLVAADAGVDPERATAILQHALRWLQTGVPAITALLHILESSQIHTFLVANNDLSLTRPTYLEDAATVEQLQLMLSKSLRPTVLHQGELLSPMEATIYHQPEPGIPPFVQIGEEVKVGQTIALLEAMKMFTELPSPVDGVLLDILVENGQGVKTGTPLFKIATEDAATETTDNFIQQIIKSEFQNHFDLLQTKECGI